MERSEILGAVVNAIEIAGVAVMVAGIALTAILGLGELGRADHEKTYRRARHRLGRAILLGLELLVAGDIIRTIVERPTMGSVALLGAIVAIRTFLSFTLEIELTGELPWRGSARLGSPENTSSAHSAATVSRGDKDQGRDKNDESRDPALD